MSMCRIGSAILLLAVTAASAPDAFAAWDAVAYWKKRCSEIEQKVRELPAETTGTVVIVGDSLTQGHPVKTLAGWTVVNEGISGDRIDVPTSGTGVRHRLELVRDARPAHVFLMIGINDIWGHKTPMPDSKRYYGELVKELLKTVPGAKVHLVSVLPTGAPYADLNDEVNELNAHIRGLAAEHQLNYVDLHARMTDAEGRLRDGLGTDGIHLTPEAYALWTAALEEQLAKSK